jgi:glycosyltransferase involved in cell wall biosynthesis
MITSPQVLESQRASTGMQKISAYILTYNEAEKIEVAVSSVLWADEVVVVDSFSVDRTAQIARALGARVVDVPFKGFGDLRNRAIEACNFDWIFSLDADERCTEAVRDEILALLAGTPPHEIYMVPRRSYMMGRWIRGSGWYPNFRQPQLFRKGSIRYTLEPVHEGFEVLDGRSVGILQNAVWQFPFRNLEEVINKMNRYSTLGVPKLAGKRVSMASAFGHGLWSFIKHYIFKLGFIDGWAGFVIAFGNFEGTFYRYAKRYEETQAWQPPASKPIKRTTNQ